MSALEQLADRVRVAEVELKQFRATIDRLTSEIKELQSESDLLEEVNKFFATQIDEKISNTKYQIEALVNQGLQYIFGESIKIRIDSAFKNNKTMFSLKIVKDNVNEGVAESFGGGVLAVVACLLKISSILITKKERLLVMDESLTYVSIEFQEKLSQFLSKICEQMNFEIILITHQPKMASYANNIYKVQGTPLKGVTFNKITQEDIQD